MTTEHNFEGTHVFGELYGISFDALNNLTLLEEAMRKGIIASGASLCSMQSKQFEPSGVTLLGLLSESHTSIHTYPDFGSLFFDAFTCGKTCNPALIARELINQLNPSSHHLQTVSRGSLHLVDKQLSGLKKENIHRIEPLQTQEERQRKAH